jgi:hypothetical protein
MRQKNLTIGALLFILMLAGCQQQTQTARTVPTAETGTKAATATAEPSLEKSAIAGKSRASAEKSTRMHTSPQVPFEMTASRRGEVAPGEIVVLSFTLSPSIPVESVKTTVRALRGVVVSGELNLDHPRVQPGTKLRHTVHAKADKGVAGYVVIDVAWAGPAGSGSTTAGVEIRATGATQKLDKLGTIETDSKGNRVEVMKAEMR